MPTGYPLQRKKQHRQPHRLDTRVTALKTRLLIHFEQPPTTSRWIELSYAEAIELRDKLNRALQGRTTHA